MIKINILRNVENSLLNYHINNEVYRCFTYNKYSYVEMIYEDSGIKLKHHDCKTILNSKTIKLETLKNKFNNYIKIIEYSRNDI